jgi:hypothetical protein
MDFPLQSLINCAFDAAKDYGLLWSYLIPVVLVYAVYTVWQSFHSSNGFPTVNLDKNAWTYASSKAVFVSDSRKLLDEGARKVIIPLQ